MINLSQVLTIATLALVISCTNKTDMKLIKSLQEVKDSNGKEVTIAGVYSKAYLNQNISNKAFNGCYEIKVNDSLSVLLEAPYDSKSKRSKEEVNRLEGKRVMATGIIQDKTYMEKPSIENSPLTINIPCLREITKIEEE